jgi:hypothetical protein
MYLFGLINVDHSFKKPFRAGLASFFSIDFNIDYSKKRTNSLRTYLFIFDLALCELEKLVKTR